MPQDLIGCWNQRKLKAFLPRLADSTEKSSWMICRQRKRRILFLFFIVLRSWGQKICLNHWFSHNVTKIHNKKLSILPTFYFHDVLEQLKTNFHTNFRFKRVLGFVIECSWLSKFLLDAAFTWRPRELSCRFKKMTYFRKFCYLNSSCFRKSINLMFMSFSKNKFTLL